MARISVLQTRVLSLAALIYCSLWLYISSHSQPGSSTLPVNYVVHKSHVERNDQIFADSAVNEKKNSGVATEPAADHKERNFTSKALSERSNVSSVQHKNMSTISTNSTKPPQLGSYHHSIAFIKTYKVGGTTISSMLSAYAYNQNRIMAPINHWCTGKRSHGHSCIDITGTDHPAKLPCNFPTVNSEDFCKPIAVFVMLRDPVERLWSGYRHEVKIAGGEAFPLKRFLDSRTIVKTPSNHVLNKVNVDQAIVKAKSVNVLLHHLYDESLVYMATKTGLTLCDIMYVPCGNASWGATKCNQQTSVNMSNTDRQALNREAAKTGEQKFYDELVNSAEIKLNSEEVIRLTKYYIKLRTSAVEHCENPDVLDRVEDEIKNHAGVRRDRKGERLYHFQTEKSNPLDPMTVCLGQYCNRELKASPPPT